MTATSAGFGLRPAFNATGVIRSIRRTIQPSNTTAIYKGDPVYVDANGYVVVAAADSGRADGVFVGCEYTDSSGKRNVSTYWPGTSNCTNIVCYVIEDQNVVFEVQADGSVTLADIGRVANIGSAVGTGSNQTGLSLAQLKTSTWATTGSKHMQIIDLYPSEDNAWGDAYTIVRVKLGAQGMSPVLAGF